MRVATAQDPDIDRSADKIFVTDTAVVILDGASAFVPVPVPAAQYADLLGRHLVDALQSKPDADLPALLGVAIQTTADQLHLSPGRSPSSTVGILRRRDDRVDGLALGDSVIVLPDKVISDDRIDQLALAERRQYRERLTTGHGYDDEHRQLLRDLQTEQAKRRNVPGGYWIAEATPHAADHALTFSRPAADVPWAVLATDGAYNPMVHLGLDDWARVAHADHEALAALLARCTTWESDEDPDARDLPRAKRHDDKAIAAVRFSTTGCTTGSSHS